MHGYEQVPRRRYVKEPPSFLGCGVLAAFILSIAIWAAIIFVALHFVLKFW